MKTYSLLQVGINGYTGAGAALNGCLNDVRNIADAIQERGLDLVYHGQVTERQATAAAMRAALAEAVNQHAERVLIHYSGHGSYLQDRNRDEMFSRYDQCLVPFDYEKAGMIIDDELAAFADMAPASATVIYWLDSCHSGGSSRGLGLGLRNTARRWLLRPTARALPQPLVTEKVRLATCTAQNQRTIKAKSKLRVGTKRPNVRSDSLNVTYTDERHILIACARSNETAADALIDGDWQGAGTCALLWAWMQLGDKANYEQVSEQANVWLAENGYAQRVVVEGRVTNLKRPFLT